MPAKDYHEHAKDCFVIDGVEEFSDVLVIEGPQKLTGNYIGGICVHGGASLTIPENVRHIGTITFRPGSIGYIQGIHDGTLKISSGATVELRGKQEGTVRIASDALLDLRPGGIRSGQFHVGFVH